MGSPFANRVIALQGFIVSETRPTHIRRKARSSLAIRVVQKSDFRLIRRDRPFPNVDD